MISQKLFSKIALWSLFLLLFFDTTSSAGEEKGSIQDSLDFKIGQMIMVGFRGLDIGENHPIVEEICAHHIGGVVLFDYDVPSRLPIRNIQSPEQLRTLTRKLQSLTTMPLLIAIDHEGGQITRLKEQFGFPATLSAQKLGKKNDLKQTRKQAEKMAQILKQTGINLNFAPVVDLNVNPSNPVIGKLERSYSSNPETVTEHAIQFIRAHHEKGILTTLKHFPGHGSSKEDTHKGPVDITDTWSEKELIPYRNLIRTCQADVIMTAHLLNRHHDPLYPATLSDSTITGILRNRLGYQGVVISDDLQMGAVLENYDLETTIFRAIHAGVDILLFANNSVYEEDIASRALQIIKRFISDKKISEERIEESYRRIRKLKERIL